MSIKNISSLEYIEKASTIPDSEDFPESLDLRVDPRTNLEIIDIPPPFDKIFPHLKSTLIHFISSVTKLTRRGAELGRILLISDSALFLTWENGKLCRCIHVSILRDVIIGPNNTIAFRVTSQDEYDLLLRLPEGPVVAPPGCAIPIPAFLLEVTKRVYKLHSGQELQIHQHPNPKAIVNLTRPPSWSLRTLPIKSVRSLALAIENTHRRKRHERRMVKEAFSKIQTQLLLESELYREAEYQRLQQRCQQLEAQLADKEAELADLRNAAATRTCPDCRVRESHYASRCTLLEDRLKMAEARIQTLEAQLGDTASSHDCIARRLQEAAAEYESRIRQLETALSEAQSKHTQTQRELEAQVHTLRKELLSAQHEATRLRLIAAQVPSEAHLRAALAQRQAEIESLRSQLQQARGALAGRLSAADREYMALKEQCNLLAAELSASRAAHQAEVADLHARMVQYDEAVAAELRKLLPG